MTVPVARTSARRTVRVAAALVAGQAALCAVIGYVTLGHGFRGTEAAPTGDPLAGLPLVLSPPAVRPPRATTVAPQPPAAATSRARPPATAWSPPRPELTPTPPPKPPPAEPPAGVLVAPSPPSTDPTTGTTTAPSPDATTPNDSSGQPPPFPPTSPPTEQGVTIGDPCDLVGAPGVTSDGTAVFCQLDDAGISRWQQT